MLEWLQKWYLEQCDGEWEHEYGVMIQTLDNPGWMVTIDLSFTDIQDLDIPYTLNEISDDDWIGFLVEKKKFIGSSDPKRLNEILILFKKIWESNVKQE